MLLPIGVTIRCRDGEAGRLKYVVIDQDDGEVTHLIVERGMLLHRDIVVPVAWVEQTSAREIVLNATVADLDALPEYRTFDFIEPDPSYRPSNGQRIEETRIWVGPYGFVDEVSLNHGRPWLLRHVRLGIQDDEVLLQRGLPVQTRDGRNAGTLDHLIVESGSQRVTHLVIRRGGLFGSRQAHIVPLERVAAVTDYGVRLDLTVEELEQTPHYQPPASDAQITTVLQRALETDSRTRDAGLQVEVKDGVVRLIGTVTQEVMEAARSITRRMRGVIGFADEVNSTPAPPLQIGATVHALDGRYGTLVKVVVDPHVRRVTHMIVRKGWLLTEDRVLPIERVARVDKDGIYLNAPSAELNQHPRYEEEAFVEPLPGWETIAFYPAADTLFWGGPYFGVTPPILPVIEHVVPIGVPAGEVVLRRGAEVNFKGEAVGTLDHILFDPTSGALTHLVVQENRRRRVLVPAEWIGEMVDEAIVLTQWQPDQLGVPAYEAAHNAATSATPRTPGKRDEGKPLDPDTELWGRVTAALTADPRTASIPIEVIADRDTITLKGAVPSLKVKLAAEEIAHGVKGVLTVISELEVRQPEPTLPLPVQPLPWRGA